MIAVLRWGAAWLLSLVLVTGCTATSVPEPPPELPVEGSASPSVPSGASVGVVLPPRSTLDPAHLEQLGSDVERVGEGFGPVVRSVSTYTPESSEFVGDLAAMLADRTTDLVCVLGADAVATVLPLADLYRAVEFCAVPAAPWGDREPSISGVVVRAEELGHLLGVATRRSAGAGPVGVVLGGDDVTGSDFREGLLAGLAGVEVVEPELGPDDTLADGVEQALAEGVTVIVVDGSAGASTAAARAAEDALVVVPASIARDPAVTDQVLVSWRVRWDRLLRSPIRRVLAESEARERVVGFATDAFEVVPGAAASPTLGDALQTVIAQLVSGAQDPREPSVGAPVEPPQPADRIED